MQAVSWVISGAILIGCADGAAPPPRVPPPRVDETRARDSADVQENLRRAREWVLAAEEQRHGHFTCPILSFEIALRDVRSPACWDEAGRSYNPVQEEARAQCSAVLQGSCYASREERAALREQRAAAKADEGRKAAWLREHCRKLPGVMTGPDRLAIEPNGVVRVRTPTPLAFSGDMYECPRGTPKEMLDAAMGKTGRRRAPSEDERRDERCSIEDAQAKECLATFGEPH